MMKTESVHWGGAICIGFWKRKGRRRAHIYSTVLYLYQAFNKCTLNKKLTNVNKELIFQVSRVKTWGDLTSQQFQHKNQCRLGTKGLSGHISHRSQELEMLPKSASLFHTWVAQENRAEESGLRAKNRGVEGWKNTHQRQKEDRAVPGLHLNRWFWARELQSSTSKISTFRPPAFSYATHCHHKWPKPRLYELANEHFEQFSSSTCQDPFWQCHHVGLYKCLMPKYEYNIAKLFKQISGSPTEVTLRSLRLCPNSFFFFFHCGFSFMAIISIKSKFSD